MCVSDTPFDFAQGRLLSDAFDLKFWTSNTTPKAAGEAAPHFCLVRQENS